MKRGIDELNNSVDEIQKDYLSKTNTEQYTPTSDYNPATKKYVDDDLNDLSTSLQEALNTRAPLNSPSLTGTPTSPTATNGTNTTQIATTAFVQNAISNTGNGDMLKSVYDSNDDGIVDAADSANTAANLTGTQATAINSNTAHRNIISGNPHGITATTVNCLSKTNTTTYTPTSNYHPATKKYVDDNAGGGSGVALNVKDFGAVGDGTTDDRDAIVSCFNAAGNGDEVIFPKGNYKIDGNVIQTYNRILVSGNNSQITCHGASSGFKLNGEKTIFRDFYFTRPTLPDGTIDRNEFQTAITFGNTRWITVSNVSIQHCGRGIFVRQGYHHHLMNIRARNIVKTVLEIGNVVGATVNNLMYDTDVPEYHGHTVPDYKISFPQPDEGILIYGEGCQMSDMDILHAGKAFHLVGTDGTDSSPYNAYSDWNYVNGCYFDKSEYGAYISSNVAGHGVRGIQFDQCWFSTHSNSGLESTGNNFINGICLNSCWFINNRAGAIRLYGETDETWVNGCIFAGNCQGNGDYSDIVCSTNDKNKYIINNFFGNWGAFGSNIKAEIERSGDDGKTIISNNIIGTNYTQQGHVIGSTANIEYGPNFGGFTSA